MADLRLAVPKPTIGICRVEPSAARTAVVSLEGEVLGVVSPVVSGWLLVSAGAGVPRTRRNSRAWPVVWAIGFKLGVGDATVPPAALGEVAEAPEGLRGYGYTRRCRVVGFQGG